MPGDGFTLYVTSLFIRPIQFYRSMCLQPMEGNQMSKLRDAEAIRADLAVLAEQPHTQQGARAMGDLAADVEPLLSALADRDAKLAAPGKFLTSPGALEAVATAICPGSYCEAHSECREDAQRAVDALAAALSLSSVPTSPQTKSNARLFLNGKPVDEVLRPGRPITEPPRPANQIVITPDDLLPSPTEDELR